MIVCGVDIKAKEARLALVEGLPEQSVHIKCTTKKLALLNDEDLQSLLTMQASIAAFASQNKVDAFVIKGRQSSGDRASGGITFKIEALFQLLGTPVVFVKSQTLARFAKGNLGGVPSSILAYQQDAYRAASWHLSK